MSDVNANDFRIINSREDVIDTYLGARDCTKTGVELEIAYFNPQANDLAPMSLAQNKVIKNASNEALGGDWVRNEPTSDVLEIGTTACRLTDLRCVMDDADKKLKLLSEKAKGVGLKRSYFQELPEHTSKELLQGLVDVERYRAFFGPPRADMKDIAAYFSVCKSNQVSVSYKNPEHMLENVRRLYFLAPFLYMITDNSSGFDQGKAFKGHAGMRHRASLKGRGGVPSYVYTAKDGEEYTREHIQHVMNNPLYVYYDENGTLQRLPSGTWWTFDKELRERGLNTATNYFFAESVLWPDVKIAALKDDEGQVYNHRFEARMFGVGIHQHQSALLIVAGLAGNPVFAEKTDRLLKGFGFDTSDMASAKATLEASYIAAMNHDHKFMDVAFGTGQMLEFSKKFADLLEEAFLVAGYDEELAPILQICRNGCTDAKVNRLLFPTLDAVLEQQRAYDETIFENPNQNARMIFDNDLKKLKSLPCGQGAL